MSKTFSINAIFLIFLAFVILGAFGVGLIVLIMGHGENQEKINQEVSSAIQEKEKSEVMYDKLVRTLPEGPDWWITYYPPACYQPKGERIKEIGATRIHWKRIEGGEVDGTQLASDVDTTFEGTLQGGHLELTDFEFQKKGIIEPFKIAADFHSDGKSFKGIYKAKMDYAGLPYEGCPADGNISGPVYAKPM